MIRSITTALVAISLMFSSSAWAAQLVTVHSLPDQGAITITGTVAKVKSASEFTLRDNSGSVDVIVAGDSTVLKEGEKVTVNGTVQKRLWGLMGTQIAATDVDVHKDLPTAISDAVMATTGISLDSAKSVDIGSLPDQGKVKINGIVEAVGDEKNFTLKDNTGTVGVYIESAEKVMLTKGAEVTVIGYIKDGMLGKKVNATHVIIVSDAR